MKIPNTIRNGYKCNRWINLDNVLYLESYDMDKSSIVFNVSRGDKNNLTTIYTDLTLEDLANHINQSQ